MSGLRRLRTDTGVAFAQIADISMGSAPAQIDPKLGRSLSSLYDTGLPIAELFERIDLAQEQIARVRVVLAVRPSITA
jgi:hypothetical protein